MGDFSNSRLLFLRKKMCIAVLGVEDAFPTSQKPKKGHFTVFIEKKASLVVVIIVKIILDDKFTYKIKILASVLNKF